MYSNKSELAWIEDIAGISMNGNEDGNHDGKVCWKFRLIDIGDLEFFVADHGNDYFWYPHWVMRENEDGEEDKYLSHPEAKRLWNILYVLHSLCHA